MSEDKKYDGNEEKKYEEGDKQKKLWKTCSCMNPPKGKKVQSPDGVPRLIINNDKLWDKQTIRVYFINGSKSIQDKIYTIAKEWEQYINIVFIRSTNKKKSDIRVELAYDGSAWSYVGTDSINQPVTMHYGWFISPIDPDDNEYHATVLHEFGHALGFEHELQHPFQAIPWDKSKVYARYKKTQGWDEREIDAQVLNRLPSNGNYLLDAKIDVDSIMCYEIETDLLKENTDLGFSNKRNHRLTSEDKHLAYASYLFDFPDIGTQVQIKNKPQVLESFEMAGRNDYINEERDIHNNSKGQVIAHHVTNGILVSFENGDKLWYEPTAMIIIQGSNTKPAIKPKERFFVGDRVKWSKSIDEAENVGTIRYHKSDDLTKVTILISNQRELVDIADLEKRVFYYNWPNVGINPSLSLKPFSIGKQVKLKKNKVDVMRGFDMAGRDDYERKIEQYLDKSGKIVKQHPTNGLQIQFADGQKYWLEPACLDSSPVTNMQEPHNRMLVDAKAKVMQKGVDYSGYVGHVCLNYNNDNIRLSIGDTFVEYPPNYLQIVSSFFLI